MVMGGFAVFSLAPHTLVITPAKEAFHVEVDGGTAAMTANVMDG
jgi:AraC family transcriptional activator of mtrCDE